MKVCVIDYQAGNAASVINALRRLKAPCILSSRQEDIRTASHVIFPGVGHAAPAMASIRLRGLQDVLPDLQQPFLGICLGLQLLCAYSEEGSTQGLGIFSEQVHLLKGCPKIPHMGWNRVTPSAWGSKLVREDDYFYFVHSYAVTEGQHITSCTTYALPMAASMEKDNFFAVQFHPEKSGSAGEKLLRRFITL